MWNESYADSAGEDTGEAGQDRCKHQFSLEACEADRRRLQGDQRDGEYLDLLSCDLSSRLPVFLEWVRGDEDD